jgi:hypothetical protein
MAQHDALRYLGKRWCISSTMKLACGYHLGKSKKECVVNLGTITSPLVFHSQITLAAGKGKKKIHQDLVSVMTLG